VGRALIILVIIIAMLLVLLCLIQSHQNRSRPATVGVSTSIGKASKMSMLLQNHLSNSTVVQKIKLTAKKYCL